LYVHGHKAGGTNPSLVEMLFFRKPIIAYECNYNIYTTGGKAVFFKDVRTLKRLLKDFFDTNYSVDSLFDLAVKEYRWEVIAKKYEDLLQ
jgi:glycosyltransferase involved in cell wall biosynthesis